jgi:hypothetical protein
VHKSSSLIINYEPLSSKFVDTIIKHSPKCEPRERESRSHPDSSRVDKGDADLHGDPATAEPAAEEDGGPQLVGERRRDAAAEVPRGALQSHTNTTGWEFGAEAPHRSKELRSP